MKKIKLQCYTAAESQSVVPLTEIAQEDSGYLHPHNQYSPNYSYTGTHRAEQRKWKGLLTLEINDPRDFGHLKSLLVVPKTQEGQ